MLHESQVAGWPGRTMFDRDGARVGTIEDVFADERTGAPAWVTVSSGLFGRKHHFVPIAHAREVEDGVAVPLDGTLVKDAPRVDQDGDLTAEDEAILYRHYGMADEDPASGASADDRDERDRDGHGVVAAGLADRDRHEDRDHDGHRDRDPHEDRDHDRDTDHDGPHAGIGGAAVGGATAASVAGAPGGEPELRDREAAQAEAAGERAVVVARERRQREEREEAERREADQHVRRERAERDEEESARFREAAARSKAAFLENQAAAEREGRPAHEAEHAAREASAVPYGAQPLDRDRAQEDLDAGSAPGHDHRTEAAPDPREHPDPEPATPTVRSSGPRRARPGAGTRLRRLVRAITPDKDDHHG